MKLNAGISKLTNVDELSLKEVLNSKCFKLLKKEEINLGIQKNSIWIRFTLFNQSHLDDLILKIAYPLLNDVELFIPKGADSFKSVHSGLKIPFSKKEIKIPSPSFHLEILPGEIKTYYIRIKSPDQIIVPISIEDRFQFVRESSKDFIISSLFLGAILIMAVYHLFLFFLLKDRNYLYFVIYIVFFEITQIGIDGFTFEFAWPESPFLASTSTHIFACFAGVAALLLAHKFLQIKRFAYATHKIFIVFMAFFAIAFLLIIFGFRQTGFIVMQITTSLSCILGLGTSYYVMRQKYLPARLFFYSWLIFLLASLAFILKDYNILPYNFITRYAVQMGAFIEISLLSFGLAYRINIFKNERDASRLLALEEAQRNERIIKGQNIILEQKVNERTLELQDSNEYLENSLENLKQTQAQLVSAEKMSSLGQLTAGIAHEINNPINFVASNISPLERDIDVLIQTIHKIEEISGQEMTQESKKENIEQLKEEYDINYTIEEINYLLKGIKDGAHRTATIVKSLRTFSRIDQSGVNFVDINVGLEATIVIVKHELYNISLEKDLRQIPNINCNSGKLNQVFLNIITNAIFAIKKKFDNEAGGVLKINSKADSDFIYIAVEDNGIGMSQETKEKIFNPFFTTKDVGEGTGLGMSISSTIITQHNGEIIINSKEGVGTELIIKIPIA